MRFNWTLKVGILIALLLGLAIIIFEVARTLYAQYPEQDFCSTNDEVYKTIVADFDEWTDTMRQRLITNDLDWGRVNFTVPSGRTYTASSFNVNSYRSYLFVVLKRSWNERYGFIGYIYSTLGTPSLDDKYEVKYLANDIYCYERKPGYD